MTIEPGGDGVDRGCVAQHADLHRADIEIGEHGVDLRSDESPPAPREWQATPLVFCAVSAVTTEAP